MPQKKKYTDKMKELGYEYSHTGSNHIVYTHKVLEWPYDGYKATVCQGTHNNTKMDYFIRELKKTVDNSLELMEKNNEGVVEEVVEQNPNTVGKKKTKKKKKRN